MQATTKGKLVQDTLRRFPEVKSLTLAKYLVSRHPDLFESNIERTRALIRSYRGALGDKSKHGIVIPKIEMPKSLSLAREPYKLKAGIWLILSDIHVPFHSVAAVESALKYGLEHGITGVLLNGDCQDCAAVSPWPAAKRDFCREVEEYIDFLDWLRQSVGDRDIVLKLGNHEDRLHSYYVRHAPELVELPVSDMDTILSLEHRKIECLLPKQKIEAGYLSILHGHELRGGTSSVNPARWLFLKAKGIAICGHFHRTSDHTEVNIKGELIATWSLGCLCDLRPEYNPECNNWNHGFGVLHLDDSGMFEFVNKKILPNGKVV